MSAGKVLIILSDGDKFPVHKSDGSVSQEDTGLFLTELAKPLGHILDAGYDVVFGNWWSKRQDQELLKRKENENNIRSPRPFSSISDGELKFYAGVFIPGGHAPISDLGDYPEPGRILLHFHNEHKATAVICHGPYALLPTKYAPNSNGFAYEGYKLTSWSDAEEQLVEKIEGGEIPVKVESALAAEGAEVVSTTDNKLLGSVTVGREVLSASNPTAANTLGSKFVETLQAS